MSREINIERVFVGLRRAWHPPSAAVESSFTRLTQSLGVLFGRLGADPDLAGLHAEVYRDFPGLPALPAEAAEPAAAKSDSADRDGERRRKGFYFCNSLIQLMEDVYLDLKLELDYLHPDNSGWMNLFRHWSQSDTFRLAWAVSASTYGLRFQDFCRRRLRLSLGSTELESLWEKGVSELSPRDAAKNRTDLEPAEQRLIEMFTIPNVRGKANEVAERVEQVVVGSLVVPSSRTNELEASGRSALEPEDRSQLARLTSGIALLGRSPEEERGRVLTLRVRRHLRSQGLARLMMNDLVCRLGATGVSSPSPVELEILGLPAGGGGQVKDIFRSVFNEVQLAEHRPASSAAEDPVFGRLPLLPYTGVVRPARVTWLHAIGFCYWVLAGSDGQLPPPELQAVTLAIRDWAGSGVDARETAFFAWESLYWYFAAKRPAAALMPEVEALLLCLRKQEWFDQERHARLRKGLDNIVWADHRRAPDEAAAVAQISTWLGVDPAKD